MGYVAMTESTNGTTVPPSASITDNLGAVWTIRLSDRAVLKDGAATNIANILELWYLNQVVWAFDGVGWQQALQSRIVQWGTGGTTTAFPTNPVMPTTPGLRMTVGPKVLASFSGVQISAGANIQAVVDANSAGTTYVLAIGTYTNQSVTPKTGDRFIGLYNGTSGAVLDGNNTAGAAFFGSAGYVVIQNLFIKKYNNATQFGSVNVTGNYLIVQECDISLAVQGAGVYVGHYALVIGNRIHNNGQQGYSVHGDILTSFFPIVGVLFDSNEIDNNNPSQSTWAGSEQGGGKALFTQYLTFWYNYSHDNGGSAFWTDTDNIYTKYWYNKIDGSGWNGIEHEQSYNASIIGNLITGVDIGPSGLSGFFSVGAITIENSGGATGAYAGFIEIAYNTITVPAYGRAIAMRQQNRGVGSSYSTGDFRWLNDISIHHNIIDWSAATAGDGLMGVKQDTGDTKVFWVRNNITYDFNTYTIGNNYVSFVWNNNSNLTFQEWQALGFDVHGTGPGPQPPSWSSLAKHAAIQVSGSSLIAHDPSAADATNRAGRAVDSAKVVSGAKKYCEITLTTGVGGVGLATKNNGFGDNAYLGSSTESIGLFDSGAVYFNQAQVDTCPTYVTGNVIGLAIHGGNKVWLSVNGVFGGNPGAGTGGIGLGGGFGSADLYPAYDLKGGLTITGNFGPTFAHTPPSGFTGFI